MNNQIIIRQFVEADANQVRELFIRINRLLAPPDLVEAFESYIVSSLKEEMDRIQDYYKERRCSFWVAAIDGDVIGMFGLEPSGSSAMELRRMYVAPDKRHRGVAQKMLLFAEDNCRACNIRQIDLSTSEIQSEALSFYRKAGYELVREELAEVRSNKTIGGGVRRFHFKKGL